MATNIVPSNTLITTKLLYNGSIRRFRIYLKDCGANTLPEKLKELLAIPADQDVIFERWSDSAAAYVVLDPNKPAVYKQLYRAAKAKLKLRIKVTHPEAINAVPSLAPSASSETLLPAYSTSAANSIPVQAHTKAPVIPLDKVNEAIAAYLDGEEGRLKLRTTIGEEVEKEMEKRSLTQSTASIQAQPAPAQAAEEAPSNAAETTNPLAPKQVYAVYCNICNDHVEGDHYHCHICDDGDFDLCERCMKEDKYCTSADHWMNKRTINSGDVTLTREFITGSKTIPYLQAAQAAKDDKGHDGEDDDEHIRTCNCCCEDFEETHFVECMNCPDYDLCLSCHTAQKHGHNPSHRFKPATDKTNLSAHGQSLLEPGRNYRHYAVCDGCDKQIYGVRHKCFTCPDWDYCDTCHKSANEIHPGHRFAALYEPLGSPVSKVQPHHHGIYCDGTHCKNKTYSCCIVGVRYKCAICPDFDLCATCEASPLNTHNATHPLIKFKSPVRNCTVQTVNEATAEVMGDRQPSRSSSVITNASTSVQTMAEIQPTTVAQTAPEAQPVTEVEPEVEAQTSEEMSPVAEAKDEEKVEAEEKCVSERGDVLIMASYCEDYIKDGTAFAAGEEFTQTWTCANSGVVSWPIGTTVQFLGGDYMGDKDITVTTSKTEAGKSVNFSVTLNAPPFSNRRLISYWGLVTADGVRFGPQLWVEIEVKNEEGEVKQEIYGIYGNIFEHMRLSVPRAIEQLENDSAKVIQEKEVREELQTVVEAAQEAAQEAVQEAVQEVVQEMVQEEVQEEAQEQAQEEPKDDVQQEVTLETKEEVKEQVEDDAERVLSERFAELVEFLSEAIPTEEAATLQTEEVDTQESERNTEDTEDGLAESHVSEMIFPTLDKESPVPSTSHSIENILAEPATVVLPSSAASITTTHAETLDTLSVVSEDFSLDDELDTFMSDDEDYDLVTASDDEDFARP